MNHQLKKKSTNLCLLLSLLSFNGLAYGTESKIQAIAESNLELTTNDALMSPEVKTPLRFSKKSSTTNTPKSIRIGSSALVSPKIQASPLKQTCYVMPLFPASDDILTAKEQEVFSNCQCSAFYFGHENFKAYPYLSDIFAIEKLIKDASSNSEEKPLNFAKINFNSLDSVAQEFNFTVIPENQTKDIRFVKALKINEPFLKSLSQKFQKNIIYLEVGMNQFGCMDIAKKIITVSFNSESNEIIESLETKSLVSDHEIISSLLALTPDTVLICNNTYLKRILFSSSLITITESAEIFDNENTRIKKQIFLMNKVRSVKNRIAQILPPSAVVLLAGGGMWSYRNAIQHAFEYTKELIPSLIKSAKLFFSKK